MLAAFGFLRFSCSFFTHCFAKTKRTRRRGDSRREGSDLEDEDSIYLSRRAVSAAKDAIARVAIHVRPRRSSSRLRFPSLWTCFLKRNPTKHETVVSCDVLRQGGETETDDRDQEVRNRRTCNKGNRLSDVFRTIPWPQLDTDRECADSLSSGDCSHYPSGSLSEGEFDSCGFDMGSSYSPLTSVESYVNKDGLNPTFFGIHSSDEEETEMLQKQLPMRRISSFVNGDHQLKESAHDSRNQQLLINPAYRRDSAESPDDDSDVGDTDCEAETKMKSLKSLVKTGCLALPTSIDLFDSQYITNTSLNPTYGDHMLPSDLSDAEDGDIDTRTDDADFSYLETSFSLPPSPLNPTEWMKTETFGRGFPEQTSNRPSTWSPRSLPMLSLCELGGSGSRSENMGTLTWQNVIFSHAEASDDDNQHHTPTEANKTIADLQIRWRKTLYTEEMELDGLSDGVASYPHRSAVSDPAMHHLERVDDKPPSGSRQGVGFKRLPRKAKGISRRVAITPIRSISHEAFEEIDFKGHPVSEIHPGKESGRTDQGAKFSKSKASSNRRSHSLLAAGLKHTRCALRSLTLLVSRVEIFAAPKKK